MDRDRKRQLKNQFKSRERAGFAASYPLPVPELKALFDHLDRDEAPPCDHTLAQTEAYLKQRRISEEPVISWLLAHGGGCDCEVLLNVHGEVAEAEGWDD